MQLFFVQGVPSIINILDLSIIVEPFSIFDQMPLSENFRKPWHHFLVLMCSVSVLHKLCVIHKCRVNRLESHLVILKTHRCFLHFLIFVYKLQSFSKHCVPCLRGPGVLWHRSAKFSVFPPCSINSVEVLSKDKQIFGGGVLQSFQPLLFHVNRTPHIHVFQRLHLKFLDVVNK